MYESSNDGLVSLSELAKGLGIAGLKTKISKEDFPVTEFVKLKELYVDEKYQRLLNEQMIKKAEKFDPRLSRPLLTYKRPDGKRAIVDGQQVDYEWIEENDTGFSAEKLTSIKASQQEKQSHQ